MSRVFITGSADGLGRMAAELLLSQGHQVVIHGRNEQRSAAAMQSSPKAEAVVTGDLSSIEAAVQLADSVNALGVFDAIIHNAGVGYHEPKTETADGLPHVFAINTLAPYILTSLIRRPGRLIYLSSTLHEKGDASLQDLTWQNRPWRAINAYSDSKLHDLLLAFAVARKWKNIFSNAVHPGWVATKMGGTGATDELDKGHETQAWLAVSNDTAAKVSGGYFFHKQPRKALEAAYDTETQEKLLAECARISGVNFPH